MIAQPDTRHTSIGEVDTAVRAILAEYEILQLEEDRLVAGLSADELGRRRNELMASVGPATGQLLNLLVRESGARNILELGTSFGYSTIWLAAAASATGGRVTTVDIDIVRQERARIALERAGLQDYVECWCGDGLAFLASTAARFDFVLIDVWKDLYIPCLDGVRERLRPGAIVIADNMLRPTVMRLMGARYEAHARTIPDLDTVVLPVGSGLAVSRYRASAATSRR